MSLSDFGNAAVDQRLRLVGALVQRLTDTQPASERHRQLVGAALENVTHHRFGDADPRVVDELVDRLSDRFGEHAQFDKQRALQLLRAHLHELPAQSLQYEFQHRVLAFLYAAARSPLNAHYSAGPLVDSLEAKARTAVVGPPTYLSDASSDADSWIEELGAYSPSSRLSDWSDVAVQEGGEDGMASASAEVAPAAHERAAGAAAAAAGASSPPGRLSPSPDAALARLFPDASRQAPRRATPYTRTSLSVWLASKASGGQPARLLQPALCFHEGELLQQTVHMLQGVSAPGPAFQLDPVRGAYSPCPGVHRASSSQGSARALLARFCSTASALRRVRAFCAAAGGRGSSSGEAEPDQARLLRLPSVVAFAAAVGEQLQVAERQLLVLQSALDAGALLSLQQLQQRTACLAEQAALLDGLVRRCSAWRGSAADTAASLLTALYQALQLQLLQARSQGGVLAAMLLSVFAASCRPLLATLHAWLYRGVLDDPHQEFFVQAAPGAAIPTDSPRFWSEAFTLRPAGGAAAAAAAAAAPGGGPPPAAAPCFLAPLAESILSAGKSTLLLQAYSAWRLAAAAASAEQRSAGGGASGGRGAWGTEGPPSPAKRRLSEFGALGFSAADSQQGQQGQPYGVPQPPATAAAASLAWLREASPGAGGGEGPGPEPLALHQQLLLNLEAQLHEQLSLTAGVQVEGAQPPGEEALQLHEDGSAEAGAGAGGSAGGDDGSSSASSEHELQHEWLAGAATCDAHTLQLPPLDMLPPLPVVPACAEALPAARTATISPADVAAAAGCEATPASSASAEPSIAERMRQAAAVRAAQAMCAAAEQLPDLLIPPAPFKALSGAARGDHAADGAAGGAAQRADEAAAQFESGAWQEWYRQTAAALSQQLHVLDCLGGGGASGNQRQLLSSYGVPLGLTPYSGSACDQLWGYRPGGGARQLPSAALGPAAAAEAPPLDVLLQHSLLRPVQAQVEAAGGELCTALLRHGLLRQLGMLRDTYLLSSQALQPFVSFLLHRISNVGGLDRLSEFEANAALQDALAAGGRSTPLRCSLHILPAPPPAQAPSGALPPRVHALARLRLRVEPGWPLALVVGEEMLAQYSSVMVLLLQLRWVKRLLQTVRYQGWKAGRRASQCAAARDGLQHQMTHLVDAVLQYVADRVVAASAWLEQALEACTSLDEMHRCRAKYQRAVARYCLLGTEGVARLVHEGLLHLLNACLQYCAVQRQLSATSAALAALGGGGAADGSAAGGAPPQPAGDAGSDGEADVASEGAAAPPLRAGPAGVQWAGRRAELARRRGEAQGALVRLRHDWSSRQRLLLRVLSTKAAEAGSHADELRQLLGALDFSRFHEAGL